MSRAFKLGDDVKQRCCRGLKLASVSCWIRVLGASWIQKRAWLLSSPSQCALWLFFFFLRVASVVGFLPSWLKQIDRHIPPPLKPPFTTTQKPHSELAMTFLFNTSSWRNQIPPGLSPACWQHISLSWPRVRLSLNSKIAWTLMSYSLWWTFSFCSLSSP